MLSHLWKSFFKLYFNGKTNIKILVRWIFLPAINATVFSTSTYFSNDVLSYLPQINLNLILEIQQLNMTMTFLTFPADFEIPIVLLQFWLWLFQCIRFEKPPWISRYMLKKYSVSKIHKFVLWWQIKRELLPKIRQTKIAVTNI